MEIVKESPDDRLMTLSVGPQRPVQDTLDLPLSLMEIILFIAILIPAMCIEEKRKCVSTVISFKIYLILSVLLFMILIILHIRIV